MRVMGCLDETNAELIGSAVQMFTTSEPLEIALLAVIDAGPRGDIDRMRERFSMRSRIGAMVPPGKMKTCSTPWRRNVSSTMSAPDLSGADMAMARQSDSTIDIGQPFSGRFRFR